MGALQSWIISSLLLTLRIAPLFAFAPPFTLVRMPRLPRVLLGLGIAACLAGSGLPGSVFSEIAAGPIAAAAFRELFVGSVFVLAFQLAFAALSVAGRVVDIQAGFGLALLIDPSSRAQSPLTGTLFAYAAGLIFFAMNGHHELLRLLAASLEAVPLGTAGAPRDMTQLAGFMSAASLISFGVAGGAILMLFLADIAIAMMARTMPQMNVLLLGFQVKTILMLAVLAGSFGMAGALLARLMALTLSTLPRLL